ncbi:DUF502 domain-containing protein [Myxococcota bacterium]|nr:DUF502 domain-containing protein [Myxococcota bacterium]
MFRKWLTALNVATRRYFVAGILFFAPIGITVWAIGSIIVWLDNLILPRLLKLVIPGQAEAPPVPLIGMFFTFLVIILMGVIARHVVGGEFIRFWERQLARVPVARNIYSGVKQLSEAIFTKEPTERFNRVVMIQYPRPGIYALAFTTGLAQGVAQEATQQVLINCFLPTTPNPTSGFYLLVPREEVTSLDISVEDAFKLVMSAGLVSPDALAPSSPTESENPSIPTSP